MGDIMFFFLKKTTGLLMKTYDLHVYIYSKKYKDNQKKMHPNV